MTTFLFNFIQVKSLTDKSVSNSELFKTWSKYLLFSDLCYDQGIAMQVCSSPVVFGSLGTSQQNQLCRAAFMSIEAGVEIKEWIYPYSFSRYYCTD